MAITIKELLDQLDGEKANPIKVNITGIKSRDLDKEVRGPNLHLMLMYFLILSELNPAHIEQNANDLLKVYWKLTEGDMNLQYFVSELQKLPISESDLYKEMLATKSGPFQAIFQNIWTMDDELRAEQIILLEAVNSDASRQLAHLITQISGKLTTITAQQQVAAPPPPPPPPPGAPPPPPMPMASTSNAPLKKSDSLGAKTGSTTSDASSEGKASPPDDQAQAQMAAELQAMLRNGGRGSLRQVKKRQSMMPTAEQMADIMEQQEKEEDATKAQASTHRPDPTVVTAKEPEVEQVRPTRSPLVRKRTSSNGSSFQGMPKEPSPFELHKQIRELRKQLKTMTAERDALQQELDSLKTKASATNAGHNKSSIWSTGDGVNGSGDDPATALKTTTVL